MTSKEQVLSRDNQATSHTVQTMKDQIGRTVKLRVESMLIDAQVTDAKASYGRVRLLITPLAGSGSQWVEESRLSL